MNAEPPTGPETPPRLDAQALARLRELDPDGRQGVVQRVLKTYESSLQRLIAQFVEARDAGDTVALKELAHKLKSSSAAVGALELAARCGDLERRIRAGETGELAAHVENLLTAAGSALAAVGAMLRP